jgi:ABC-type antimicrobial peptide transport system permease subunit
VVLRVCLIGGVVGEFVGIVLAVILSQVTVVPTEFNLVSLGAAFPVTVLLAVAATLVPAWQAAGASPALLRKE